MSTKTVYLSLWIFGTGFKVFGPDLSPELMEKFSNAAGKPLQEALGLVFVRSIRFFPYIIKVWVFNLWFFLTNKTIPINSWRWTVLFLMNKTQNWSDVFVVGALDVYFAFSDPPSTDLGGISVLSSLFQVPASEGISSCRWDAPQLHHIVGNMFSALLCTVQS